MTLRIEDIDQIQKGAIENGFVDDDLILLFRDLSKELSPINQKLNSIISFGIVQDSIRYVFECENELPVEFASVFFTWLDIDYNVKISKRKFSHFNYFIVDIN